MPNVYLSEDYLVRLISQAVAALQVIAGLRAAQQYKDAERKVDEALEGQLGLRARLLKELDDARLKEMLVTNGMLEMERFLLVALSLKLSPQMQGQAGCTGRFMKRASAKAIFRSASGRSLIWCTAILSDGWQGWDLCRCQAKRSASQISGLTGCMPFRISFRSIT